MMFLLSLIGLAHAEARKPWIKMTGRFMPDLYPDSGRWPGDD